MTKKQKNHKGEPCIIMLSQEKYFRQRIIKYLNKHTVTEASRYFKISRKTIYKWLKRYDGTLSSLEDRSHRPHHSPNAHTEKEIKIIKRLLKKHKWNDLILIYQELTEKYAYTRSYGGFKRLVYKLKSVKIKKKKKRKSKPYKRAEYIGQKVQVDVKFVPSYCVTNGKKYYEYIAVDECSRWAYRQMYDEHSTYSSYKFLLELIKAAPFQIREIQTDNGREFTNALVTTKNVKTMFESALEHLGIKYNRIRVATPRHNGKVERQNRQDEERFYRNMKMYNLDDGKKQLATYQRKSNNYIKTCLNMKSPNQIVAEYLGVM